MYKFASILPRKIDPTAHKKARTAAQKALEMIGSKKKNAKKRKKAAQKHLKNEDSGTASVHPAKRPKVAPNPASSLGPLPPAPALSLESVASEVRVDNHV
ncbi:MAG TPA: hypothetical protein VGO47_05650 [Chlamydiales bacterium]|nr:hypothetical protein [Chlamydiales bacterium]